MLSVIWFLADTLDDMRLPANPTDAVWVETPSSRLRNPDGRSDNAWLKVCLDRLLGIQLHGEHSKGEWAAVLLAQWEIKEGGSLVRLLVPPAAVQALKAPATFAKIEITAAFKLGGYARRLYGALADKKRMQSHPYWEYSLDELRLLFDVRGKYPRWAKFNLHVLQPALDEINDFGTVKVKATLIKRARSIIGVRFDWDWKDPHEASETVIENERHAIARRKSETVREMPPLSDEAQEPAPFKKEGTPEERGAVAAKLLKDAGFKSKRVK